MSQDEPLLMKSSTVEVKDPVNNTVEKFNSKIRHNFKDINSVVVSSTKSVATCHKCGKKGHIKRNCKSNINGSDGGLSKRSTRELPKWVINKPVISYVPYLTTDTMNCNNKQ